MSKGPEAQIQSAIMDYLAARRVLAFRQNSGMVMATYKGKTRAVRYGVPGMADVLAFPNGRPLWIEVKAAKGRTTAEQDSFAALVRGHGQAYIVAKSIEDVEAALEGVTR